jgi:redox-sensitive bicupin YhaK (pirin superfamily)
VHFGVLRVLNDDTVAPGQGFGTHPHDNMEIISIPLEGDLEHRDSMGNVALIRQGDIQVMSAGTGVTHSEYNKNSDQEVKFLQIWIFPRERGVEPRYDQISLGEIRKTNELYQVLSPSETDQGVWIHQDAWFHMGEFSRELSTTYELKHEGNGVYAFVIDGEVEIAGQSLGPRDGFGIREVQEFQVKAQAGCKLLLMEVPMN